LGKKNKHPDVKHATRLEKADRFQADGRVIAIRMMP
jgi:hypothetical protein